jgi:hypothetical protein
MRMNRRTVVIVVGTLVVLAGTLGLGAQANGEPEENQGCSEATIRGTYGIQISGTRPSAPGGAIESVIGVVIRHYDGQGQFTQVGNVKGSISGMLPDQPGLGTYQVNSDCSGVSQAHPNSSVLLEERFVIVDDGNEIRSMTSLPPPVMVTGTYKRIHRR